LKNTLRFLFPAALAAVLCLTVFCTIKDDNGNPADPGTPAAPSDSSNGGGNQGGNNNAQPVMIVSPGQITVIDSNYYVHKDSTLTLNVRLMTDTASGAAGINNEKVTVYRSDAGAIKTTYKIKSGSDSADATKRRLTVTTDKNGLATVSFKSTVDDAAELTFEYGSLKTKVQIVVTNNPPSKMTIEYTLMPNPIFGSTICTVTVQVKNAFNNPVVNEIVEFSTSVGIITAESVTDSDGKARAILTGDEGDVFANVIAVLKNDPTRNAEITIFFIEDTGNPLKRIYFNKPKQENKNGVFEYTITVLVKNNFNNPLNEEVRFISTAGMIDALGTSKGRGEYSAILTQDWDSDSACASVTAFLASDTTCRGTQRVCFSKVAQNIMTVTADRVSINKTGSDTSTVTATLRDDAGNLMGGGEPVTFTSQLNDTNKVKIIIIDSVTNSSGEARAKIIAKSTAPDDDIITVSGAGASSTVTINFSVYILTIRPVSGNPTMNFIAKPEYTTTFQVEYNGTHPSTIEVSVTMGKWKDDVIFAKIYTTTDGKATFEINNPGFSDTATIRATAYNTSTGNGITTKDTTQYFRANVVKRIELSVTPAVIGTTTGRATMTATAYDERGNRVQDEVISFNLLKAPGGGEYISPATSTTLADGTAKSYLYAGTIPSAWRGVEVVASDFTGVRSNTVNFTIAGPPRYITIRRNMGEVIGYPATYGKQFSAIVTDVNSNPVADGTEVTFSAQITGYVYFRMATKFDSTTSANAQKQKVIYAVIDEHSPIESEQFNKNRPHRPYPKFNDINKNGVPERYIPTSMAQNPVEPCDPDVLTIPVTSTLDCGNYIGDYNNSGDWDWIEDFDFCKKCLTWTSNDWVLVPNAYENLFIPFPTPTGAPAGCDPITGNNTLLECLNALYKNDPFSSTSTWDMDWNWNGVPDPNTAVSIMRTVQTTNGLADNELIYGQSDAWRIQVKVWAEAQGLVTSAPEQFVLPLAEGAEKYWNYFE